MLFARLEDVIVPPVELKAICGPPLKSSPVATVPLALTALASALLEPDPMTCKLGCWALATIGWPIAKNTIANARSTTVANDLPDIFFTLDVRGGEIDSE